MNERKLFQGNGKKSNKGITLIALVISIIVMLILAGVSLIFMDFLKSLT